MPVVKSDDLFLRMTEKLFQKESLNDSEIPELKFSKKYSF